MKILFLVGSLNLIGGIEKYNKNLISSFENINCKKKIIQRDPGGLIAKLKFTLIFIWSYFYYSPDYIICCHLNIYMTEIWHKNI